MTDEDITQKQILSDSIRRRYAYLKRRRKVRAMRIFWGRVRMLIRLACIYFLCVGIWKFMHLPQWYLPPKAFETYSGQNVEYIDLRNPTDVYIKLDKVLIRFGEINDTAQKRAKWIATILPETKNFKQKIKYIDLRWEDAHYIKLDEPTAQQAPKPKEEKDTPVQETNETDEN